MDRAVVAETRRETLRRYAIVLRLQDRGSPSCAAHSCCAWKTGTAHPCSVRSPGQSLRLRTPCVAWAPAQDFRGLGVRRDQRPPDARLIPAHPPGALAHLRLTHGEPVRPGKVSLALFLHRPHPCRLGASIASGDGLGNRGVIHVSRAPPMPKASLVLASISVSIRDLWDSNGLPFLYPGGSASSWAIFASMSIARRSPRWVSPT